ncbi:hypothetical protein AAHB54_05760 [Bacillus cereus]
MFNLREQTKLRVFAFIVLKRFRVFVRRFSETQIMVGNLFQGNERWERTGCITCR